ncbi:MAG TPA: disulfide bond formation protein DsbA [Gammaproteobacteria bacterium]|nr:disulfide bond formation protein DsbA [Gammaproteobacteria bacterium]
MKQSHFTLIALFLLVLVFIIATLFHDAGKEEQQAQRAADNNTALIKDYSVKAGSPTAKVTIVEFLDPACGTCAQFHPFVKQLMQQYPGKVNLVVRYLPFHKGSDQMVAMLEAARKQNKFWEVLELMFDTQSQWTVNHVAQPEVFWNFIDRAGVDAARIKQDMSDPAIMNIIQQDLADGKLLGADKTPSFFVNGKPLPSFGFKQLQTLVDTEVSANY